MIKNFKNYNRMNEMSNETYYREQNLVDSILDKIGKVGYVNLSEIEKEILTKASESGVESLKDYVDYSDEEVYSTDKLGHILINGVPYDEWYHNKDEIIKKKKAEKNAKHEWGNTEKYKSSNPNSDIKTPPYQIRGYKNDGSELLYYYIIWNKGEQNGMKKKFITVSDKEHPYGIMTKITSWVNKGMDIVHKSLEKDYDHFKDLSVKELNDFESFLILRTRDRKGQFDEKTKENSQFKAELNRLFKTFKNI